MNQDEFHVGGRLYAVVKEFNVASGGKDTIEGNRNDVPYTSACLPCSEEQAYKDGEKVQMKNNVFCCYPQQGKVSGALQQHRPTDLYPSNPSAVAQLCLNGILSKKKLDGLYWTNRSMNCRHAFSKGVELNGQQILFQLAGKYVITSEVQFDAISGAIQINTARRIQHGIMINDDAAKLSLVYLPVNSTFSSFTETIVDVKPGDILSIYISAVNLVYMQAEFNTIGIHRAD